MRQPVILITGASGEIGHGLITHLTGTGRPIITLDLNTLPDDLMPKVHHHVTGSVLDQTLLDRLLTEYEVDTIFHLAALLSTRSEFAPHAAHRVNVDGTLAVLEFAQAQGESHGRPVAFLYPSSIAAYGLPNLDTKNEAGDVLEDAFNHPTTMYGCNKLYCEQLGRYYARHFKQLSNVDLSGRVDFRCLRFPGLISAYTLPRGGTSDFAPELIHCAARGEAYSCFARPDTRIPLMSMPDAVTALLTLAAADRSALTRQVYNVAAFNPSAGELLDVVRGHFPDVEVTFEIDTKRQGILDTWPAGVDVSAARRDWNFSPRYDLHDMFRDYLLPVTRSTSNTAGETPSTEN